MSSVSRVLSSDTRLLFPLPPEDVRAPFPLPAVSYSVPHRSGISDQQISKTLDEHGFSNTPEIAQRFLAARSFASTEDLAAFLNPSTSNLPHPARIVNLEATIAALSKVITERIPIAIVCDYDVDGLTGGAQLAELCKRVGVPYEVHIPHRLTEGHGLNDRIVAEILRSNAQMVITIDLGANNATQLMALKDQGRELLVWDHHLADTRVNSHALMVNSHQADCALGEVEPCASGITWLVLKELITRHQLQPLINQDELLPLAALATLCDMVPLTPANRWLVKQYLELAPEQQHAGISSLITAFHNKHADQEQLRSEDLSHYLGPAINSAGRMGHTETAWELLTHFDNCDDKLAGRLLQLNSERQREQKEALQECFRVLGRQEALGTSIVIVSPAVSPGLAGLCAQTLSERYERPTVVFSEVAGVLRGSARVGSGAATISLEDLFAECSKFTLSSGGHRAAGGVTILPSAARDFSNAFERAVASRISSHRRIISSDVVASLAELTPHAIAAAQTIFEPVGMGSPLPSVHVKQAQITGKWEFGDTTVFELTQDSARCRAICFKDYILPKLRKGDIVDLAASPRLDRYRGNERVVLHIRGISRLHGTKSVVPDTIRQRSLFDNPKLPTEAPEQASAPVKRSSAPGKARERHFDFSLDEETPNVFSVNLAGKRQRLNHSFVTPVPDSYAQLFREHDLRLPRLDAYKDIKSQLEFLHYALHSRENLVCSAQTGEGKTVLALVLAAKPLQQGKRVLYLAPSEENVAQVCRKANQFLNLSDESIARLTGSQSPSKRAQLLERSQHTLFVGLAESVANDFENGRIKAEDFALIILDEGQRVSGEHASARVADNVLSSSARMIVLSGKLANNQAQLGARIERLGKAHVYHVKSEPRERIEVFSSVDRAPLEPTYEKLIQFGASAAREISELAANFKEIAPVATWARALADVPKLLHSVSREEIQNYMSMTRSLAESLASRQSKQKLGEIISFGHELNHINRLRERYERYGKAMLLTKAFDVGYLENREPWAFTNRLYGENSAFKNFLRSINYSETADKLMSYAKLPDIQEREAMRKSIFSELAKLREIDYPKMETLLITLQQPETKKALIYTGLAEHARFLAQALGEHGLSIDWLTSKGEEIRKHRESVDRRFRAGAIDFVAATSVANLGLDLESLTHIVLWEPYGINTIDYQQRIGRISRLSSENQGTVVHLALKGSDEMRRYQTLKQSAERSDHWFS